MQGLKNLTVMITGAASGIGLATAQRFHQEGANLILVDIPAIGQTELNQQFPQRMIYVQADVSTEKGLADCFAAAGNQLDVLINNAGITRDASFAKMSDADWDQVIAVNLSAVFRFSRKAGKIMKENQKGVILNAASVVAHYGNFGQANYVATKAGIIGLTKTMAKELGKYNVRVNAVAPGFTQTKMVEKVPEKILQMMAEKTPLKRLGKPEDIAAAYAFLASDDAQYITGAVLNVDGGLILG